MIFLSQWRQAAQNVSTLACQVSIMNSSFSLSQGFISEPSHSPIQPWPNLTEYFIWRHAAMSVYPTLHAILKAYCQWTGRIVTEYNLPVTVSYLNNCQPAAPAACCMLLKLHL